MEKDRPIRSVCRALMILQTINRLRSPTLMEIANETGLPYPTTFRITHTLIHEGMIEQEPFRKRYRATELVKSLSFGFQEDDWLLRAAVEPMRDFTSSHLWPVALAVRVGNRMMVKHATNKLTSQTFVNYYPGFTLPLLDCASGRAYIAFCDEQERDVVLQGSANHGPANTSMSLQLLTNGDLLEKIRQAGYADVARGQHNETPGRTSAFSVPVFDGDQLRACLTIVFFARAHSMQDAVEKYLAPLQQLSSNITAKLAAAH